MGAVGSICCEEDRKKNSRDNKMSNAPPTSNPASIIPTTLPPKKSQNKLDLPPPDLKDSIGAVSMQSSSTTAKTAIVPPSNKLPMNQQVNSGQVKELLPTAK
jgi:hypothetical protein